MPVRVFSEEEKGQIREKMFQAGMELIRTCGMTHTSVQKITQKAGIGKSTFYNFFPSKEVFVVELMQYERKVAMQMIEDLLHGREKMTKEEAKKLLRMIIFHQDSIYQYLTEEDVKVLYPVMKERGMIEDDLNSDTPQYLLDHFEQVDPNADPRIFLNLIRILALIVSQKETLREDVLDETCDLIFETMFGYIFADEQK